MSSLLRRLRLLYVSYTCLTSLLASIDSDCTCVGSKIDSTSDVIAESTCYQFLTGRQTTADKLDEPSGQYRWSRKQPSLSLTVLAEMKAIA